MMYTCFEINRIHKRSDIDTQEILLYTCVAPDVGSVSCTMLVDATRCWVCCCVLLRDCTDVAIAGAASQLWEPPDNGSTADPFSSTILSIAWEPQTLQKWKMLSYLRLFNYDSNIQQCLIGCNDFCWRPITCTG